MKSVRLISALLSLIILIGCDGSSKQQVDSPVDKEKSAVKKKAAVVKSYSYEYQVKPFYKNGREVQYLFYPSMRQGGGGEWSDGYAYTHRSDGKAHDVDDTNVVGIMAVIDETTNKLFHVLCVGGIDKIGNHLISELRCDNALTSAWLLASLHYGYSSKNNLKNTDILKVVIERYNSVQLNDSLLDILHNVHAMIATTYQDDLKNGVNSMELTAGLIMDAFIHLTRNNGFTVNDIEKVLAEKGFSIGLPLKEHSERFTHIRNIHNRNASQFINSFFLGKASYQLNNHNPLNGNTVRVKYRPNSLFIKFPDAIWPESYLVTMDDVPLDFGSYPAKGLVYDYHPEQKEGTLRIRGIVGMSEVLLFEKKYYL
jgi:hypothetical protein